MNTPVLAESVQREERSQGRSYAPRWLVIVLAVALMAVSGLAVWLYVDGKDSTASSPPGWVEASPAVVEMIDEGLAAYNNGDWEAYGASMVDDAVFQEVGTGGSGGIEGREQIIKAMTILQGWGARYERVGEILQNGNVVFFPIECDTCPRMTGEIDVVEFNDDLKITHYWTIVSD